jgi:hypothetical protein
MVGLYERINKMMWKPDRNGVNGCQRKLHNQEFHYISPSNIIATIKLQMIKNAEHLTHVRDMRT